MVTIQRTVAPALLWHRCRRIHLPLRGDLVGMNIAYVVLLVAVRVGTYMAPQLPRYAW